MALGWWPFGRKGTDDKDVDTLLAEANAASPARPAAPVAQPAAQPGDGSFRLPVEDIFMITGRGCVVTGRVEAGVATVGMQVRVVRAGNVVATTKINGIEKFRAILDTAVAGDNVGLLLDGLDRDSVMSDDLVTG
jgi:translation elongation factor EF-Tu-like GTPase